MNNLKIAVINLKLKIENNFNYSNLIKSVNSILSNYSNNILGRIGVPKLEKNFAIISTILEGNDSLINLAYQDLKSISPIIKVNLAYLN